MAPTNLPSKLVCRKTFCPCRPLQALARPRTAVVVAGDPRVIGRPCCPMRVVAWDHKSASQVARARHPNASMWWFGKVWFPLIIASPHQAEDCYSGDRGLQYLQIPFLRSSNTALTRLATVLSTQPEMSRARHDTALDVGNWPLITAKG